MNSADEIRLAKESALHNALDDVRGNDYDKLVRDIEEIQNKSKRAYVRLYEKVGEDIGGHFLDKLDYMTKQPSEVDKLINGNKQHSSAQVELQRLQDEKTRIAKMQKQKDREYLRSEEPADGLAHKTNIADLFSKYNI